MENRLELVRRRLDRLWRKIVASFTLLNSQTPQRALPGLSPSLPDGEMPDERAKNN
jgi:hypothetical protein